MWRNKITEMTNNKSLMIFVGYDFCWNSRSISYIQLVYSLSDIAYKETKVSS